MKENHHNNNLDHFKVIREHFLYNTLNDKHEALKRMLWVIEYVSTQDVMNSHDRWHVNDYTLSYPGSVGIIMAKWLYVTKILFDLQP